MPLSTIVFIISAMQSNHTTCEDLNTLKIVVNYSNFITLLKDCIAHVADSLLNMKYSVDADL